MNKLVCLIPALCITACATAPAPAGGPSVPLINSAGQVIGTIAASQATDGVAFRIHAMGLPPGVHGIHVHPVGRCDPPDGTAYADIRSPGVSPSGELAWETRPAE